MRGLQAGTASRARVVRVHLTAAGHEATHTLMIHKHRGGVWVSSTQAGLEMGVSTGQVRGEASMCLFDRLA